MRRRVYVAESANTGVGGGGRGEEECEFSLVSLQPPRPLRRILRSVHTGVPSRRCTLLPPTPLFESRRSSNLRRRAFVGGGWGGDGSPSNNFCTGEWARIREARFARHVCNFSFSPSFFSVQNPRINPFLFFPFFFLLLFETRENCKTCFSLESESLS